MTARTVTYETDSIQAARELLRIAGTHFRTRNHPAEKRARTYWDTFDWALASRDRTLTSVPDGDRFELTLRHGGELTRQESSECEPGFACDLPSGPLHDAIAKSLDVRKLLPLATVKAEDTAVDLLDELGKTVIRMRVTNGRVRSSGAGTPRRMPPAVVVTELRGYEREYERLLTGLQESLGLSPAPGGEFERVLRSLGRAIGDTASKPRFDIAPGMRADMAMKRVYLALLHVLELNEVGTAAATDPEFLHDFRVACRRTRAALSSIKAVFPPATVDKFKREFRWLGQVTGPSRDLDVAVIEFPSFLEATMKEVRPHLMPLREHLLGCQKRAHAQLRADLATARYRNLKRSWRSFLERPVPARSRQPNALRPLRDLASERIWRAYRRVRKDGRKIDDSTPDEALHELRIECKKLRYLLEFFRDLYPGGALSEPIQLLKQLQDNLGIFNDLSVQRASVRQWAGEMATAGTAQTETLLAMGGLIEELVRRQAERRVEFGERFGVFDTTHSRKLYAHLFKPAPAPAVEQPIDDAQPPASGAAGGAA